MERLTGMEWLKKQITELETSTSRFKEQIKQIIDIDPSVYNEFRAWTPLKLILLNYSLNVCTAIIKKTGFFKKRYYVDLFAGSGINKIKEKEDDFFIGSPLIASLNHSDAYDSMIFCEKEQGYSNVLESRLRILGKKNLKLIKEDYKSCFDEILKEVEKRNTYSFFFIDPHCMEFDWVSMKGVLEARSDIVFTFMCSEIWRAVGLTKKGMSKGESLTRFFGGESWKEANNAEELVNIYKSNILKERSSAPIRIIKIQSKKFNFCYYLFFITNLTRGENKWLRAIDKAKAEIESNSDVAVSMALDLVKGRQSELLQFK
jgi:three-Cys-motif partner protein